MHSFNLVDQPWAPTAQHGSMSLRGLFSTPSVVLGGNPVRKISNLKFLLAIAQRACSIRTNDDLNQLTIEGMVSSILDYLEEHRDQFDLYGDRPFLQLPSVKGAKSQLLGQVMAEIATGNNPVLNQTQIYTPNTDAFKANLAIELQSMALGGKKADNSLVLTDGYKGKFNEKGNVSVPKAGPGMGFMGYLHTFLWGDDLASTIFLNLLSEETIVGCGFQQMGVPPWEVMPTGEDCNVARSLQSSYMGRLVPMNRFFVFNENGEMHCTEGVLHKGYKDGICDTSVTADLLGKDPKVLWANPAKRPWRELNTMLAILSTNAPTGMRNALIQHNLGRARRLTESFGILSLGLRAVSSSSEQSPKGNDDYVESLVMLASEDIGEPWYIRVNQDLKFLDDTAKALYGRVSGYYRALYAPDIGKKHAEQATADFWAYCEGIFQSLVDACGDDGGHSEQRTAIRKTSSQAAYKIYDKHAPVGQPRQYDAWAQNRPKFKYQLEEAA